VLAPGPPGSIEKGELEARGHELTITTPAVARAVIEVSFDVRAAKAPPGARGPVHTQGRRRPPP
jgi:hypothetical protein